MKRAYSFFARKIEPPAIPFLDLLLFLNQLYIFTFHAPHFNLPYESHLSSSGSECISRVNGGLGLMRRFVTSFEVGKQLISNSYLSNFSSVIANPRVRRLLEFMFLSLNVSLRIFCVQGRLQFFFLLLFLLLADFLFVDSNLLQ